MPGASKSAVAAIATAVTRRPSAIADTAKVGTEHGTDQPTSLVSTDCESPASRLATWPPQFGIQV